MVLVVISCLMNLNNCLKMYRLLFVAVLVTGYLPVTLEAAEPAHEMAARATNEVALETLVADVLEHNPELGFYRAEVAAARGERSTAGIWRNPELSASVGTKRVTESAPAGEGTAWSVSVLQSFEWPGRIPLRKAIANRQVQLAELGLEQFKTALAARIRTLTFGLFAAHEKSVAAREVADRLQALREVLVQRDPAGLTPILELRIIEASELTFQRKSSEAVLAEQSALLEMNQLGGHPLRQALRVKAADLTFVQPPTLDALMTAAQTNNFEIRMRQAELEQQGLRVALTKNERFPSVSVGPYYSLQKGADREQQIGVGFSLPLPLWNRNRGAISTEEARKEQAAVSYTVMCQTIERQVINHAMAYQTKLGEINHWQPDSVTKFQEAAELADRHYRLGAVPLATFVELQKQYLEAIETLLNTRLEALSAGQQLQALTGLDFTPVAIPTPDTLEKLQK